MTNPIDYKKAFKDLQKQVSEQEEMIKIKDLILQVASYMNKSKMSEEEKVMRLMKMPSMTEADLMEFYQILKKEVEAYNEIYLKALEKEQTDE